MNKVKLFNNPHEIDKVKLPRKNKIKDLFDIAIFNSFSICLRVIASVHFERSLILFVVVMDEYNNDKTINIAPVNAKGK